MLSVSLPFQGLKTLFNGDKALFWRLHFLDHGRSSREDWHGFCLFHPAFFLFYERRRIRLWITHYNTRIHTATALTVLFPSPLVLASLLDYWFTNAACCRRAGSRSCMLLQCRYTLTQFLMCLCQQFMVITELDMSRMQFCMSLCQHLMLCLCDMLLHIVSPHYHLYTVKQGEISYSSHTRA